MNEIHRVYIHKRSKNPEVEITRKDKYGDYNSRRYLINKKDRSDLIDFTLIPLMRFTSLYTWTDSITAIFVPSRED